VGRASSMEEALKNALEVLEREKYFPNIFYVNDHGNVELLSVRAKKRAGKIVGVSWKVIRGWV